MSPRKSRQIKNVPIKYTSRDFASIKKELISHAQRYYPDTYKDFNEASFGSLMLDSVAYIGDMLSFYLDYQVNESFIDSAVEFNNVIRLGRQLGYKFKGRPSSYGTATIYVVVPANSNGIGVNVDYVPTMKRGTSFSSSTGAAFLLNEDVNFLNPSNEVVVATVDNKTGKPTTYAIRAYGQVVSGKVLATTVSVGNYQRFFRATIASHNIAEILSVIDQEGHEYHEVEHLSQNIIYVPTLNLAKQSSSEPEVLLKPRAVARRFVVEQEGFKTFLQFGYGSDNEITDASMFDPSDVVLNRSFRNYVTEASFDPNRLLENDKFGIAPSNTTLTITYRLNTSDSVNAGVGAITNVDRVFLKFPRAAVEGSNTTIVRNNIEVTNDEPIVGDVTYPSSEEVRRRVIDTYAVQNRAVTKQDYQTIVYMMPPQFGAIKRCSIKQDHDSFKRNLNLYVVSEGSAGNLVATNNVIKENLKMWLNNYKMINDTIDILDANIINIGVDFYVQGSLEHTKEEVLINCLRSLRTQYRFTFELGEPFSIAKIYQILNATTGVEDTMDVRVSHKVGVTYSDIPFNIKENTDASGRYIAIPDDSIFEIRFGSSDIQGVVQ
jgi:hypothetical protein